MDEIKAEAREAFPNAKVQEQGNKLIMTMPNGQKVTVTLHESLEASAEELSKARKAHGMEKDISVTVEGYAETVNGDGFIALSQESRKAGKARASMRRTISRRLWLSRRRNWQMSNGLSATTRKSVRMPMRSSPAIVPLSTRGRSPVSESRT